MSHTVGKAVALLVTVVTVFAVSFLVVDFLTNRLSQWSRQMSTPHLPAEPPVLGPIAQPAQDAGWVAKAMVDCEAQAAGDTGALHVLVIPVMAPPETLEQWESLAVDTLGNAGFLLRSNDALNGLRRGQLSLYPGLFVFSVRDDGTGKNHSWRPATGVSQFLLPDATAMASFRPGFHLPAGHNGPQWGAVIERGKGTCYWGSILVRAGA